jgi:YbbR domain-containing protein
MKSLLHKIFIQHWTRKLVSLVLAVIIWLVVNQTLTSTRNISNIPVRIIHLPQGKTVEGIQPNGRLAKKLTLTVVGNRALIDELTPSDLEVVIDASEKPDEWIVTVTKKNLVSLNPEIDISTGISRVYHPNFVIRMTKLITAQIPIVITQPIGEAPRGYQFLDVWPYHLFLTVSGPQEVIKRLKMKEQRITFNLSDISKSQIDELALKSESNSEVISYYVPEQWKQINIPLLSDSPIEIDDPQAKALRIDFVRCNLLPINAPLQLSVFFPPENLEKLNPENTKLTPNQLVEFTKGAPLISYPLYANGVDNLFLETVRDMIEIVIIAAPKSERKLLDWSVQFVNPRLLEDKYVATLMSDVSDREIRLLQPTLREEYLRNRFRSYMNRFQLFRVDDTKFDLNIFLKPPYIHVEEGGAMIEGSPPKTE